MTKFDKMNDLSQKEIDRIIQLKNEKKNHWGSAFAHAAWFYEFRRKNPHCSHPHLLILEAPLDSPETVQSSLNLSKLPSVEQATLDGDDGEDQKKTLINVCLLDEISDKAVTLWIVRNRTCKFKHIWVNLQGERRLATKLLPY